MINAICTALQITLSHCLVDFSPFLCSPAFINAFLIIQQSNMTVRTHLFYLSVIQCFSDCSPQGFPDSRGGASFIAHAQPESCKKGIKSEWGTAADMLSVLLLYIHAFQYNRRALLTIHMKMVVVGINLFYYCIKCISLYEIKPVFWLVPSCVLYSLINQDVLSTCKKSHNADRILNKCWFNVKAGKVDWRLGWWRPLFSLLRTDSLWITDTSFTACQKNYLNSTDLKATWHELII